MKRHFILILAMSIIGSLFASPGIRVTDADAGGFRAVFSLGDYEIIDVEGDYSAIEIPDGGSFARPGEPDIPVVSEYLLLAPGAVPSVEFEVFDSDTLPALPPRVSQFPAHENGEPGGPVVGESSIYQSGAVWPTNFASIGAIGSARGVPIGMLTICPVRYDFAEGAYIILRRARLRVDLGGYLEPPPERLRSRPFLEMLRKVTVNGSELPCSLPDDPGVYLVICPDTCWNALDEFVEHKESRGHRVITKRLSEIASPITSTAIKSYIQWQFDTLDAPPTFVILVGDTEMDDGTEVPDFGYLTFNSDHTYSLLEGDDYFSDVFLARMPIDNISEFRVLIEKIKRYENRPLAGGSDWMRRAMVVSTYDHAVTPVWNVLWVREVLLNHGFTQVDTFFENGSVIPPASDISSAIDAGLSYIDYRGWAGSDGWWEPDFDRYEVLALMNTKYPVVTSIVCGTGDFGSAWTDPCFGEAWLRAGSVTNPRGGVAFFGTTDHHSHTRYNNPINSGFYKGLFDFDLPFFGQDVWIGEAECFRLHPTEYTEVKQYFMTYEPLGDPGLMMFHGTAPELSVGHSAIEIGAEVEVEVLSGGTPLQGALVCLYRIATGDKTLAYTNFTGNANLFVPGGGSGNILLTVVSPFHITYSESFSVSGVPNVAITSVVFDDASGDGDGRIDPGEIGRLDVTIHNYGPVLKHVETYLWCDHDGIAVDANFDSLWKFWGGTERIVRFEIAASGAASGGGPAKMFILCDSRDGSAVLPFSMPLQASMLSLDSLIIDDSAGGDGDGLLEPGESAECRIAVGNTGAGDPSPLHFTVYSTSGWIDVGGGDSIVVSSIGHPGVGISSAFELSAAASAFVGTQVDIQVYRVADDGETAFDEVQVFLGKAATSDPTGPDGWGYFAFDNTDFSSGHAPTSTFEDIASTGTFVAIGDDETIEIALPFDFVFYGESFDTLSVCSNGWAAPGAQPYFMTSFYNTPIPAPNGPWGTIAPFWDDLEPIGGSGGGIYYRDFPGEGKLIVQWERMQHANIAGMDNTFQIAIFDPASHPTRTGDSPIEFRYSGGVENVDEDEEYATVGIESHSHLLGLEYIYSLRSDPGAAPLMDGRVIRFTTDCGAALVHGDVTLECGNPSEASIKSDGGHRAQPDGSGYYRFTEIVPGSSIFTCSAPGHFAEAETVTAVGDVAVGVDFDLDLAPIPGPLSAGKGEGSSSVSVHWGEPSSESAQNYILYKYLSPEGKPSSIKLSDTIYTDTDVVEGRKYWYRAAAEYENGISFPSDPDSGWIELLTDIGDAEKPTEFALRVAPNPFNSAVRISVDCSGLINQTTTVTVEIFDIAGRMVADLPITNNASALFVPTPLIWQPDESIGSGVYLVRARFDMLTNNGGAEITKKIVYLK